MLFLVTIQIFQKRFIKILVLINLFTYNNIKKKNIKLLEKYQRCKKK